MPGLDLSLGLRRTDLALSRAMTLTVPSLEAAVDWPAANRVRGQAPPDAAVELRLLQGGAVKERVPLLADGAGRWSWDPGGGARYGPGITVLAGAEAQGLQVALNGSAVQGVVAAGSSFTLTLRSATNDTVKDRRRVDLAPGESSFNVNLGDNEILSGTRILPGDALWLERAGDPLVVPVPPFALDLDLAGKQLRGRTLPGYGVRLSGASGAMDLIADDRGEFQVDLASLGGPAPRCQTVGCQWRAELTVPGGHRFVAAWGVPDLTIDLSDSIVSGHSAGGQSVAVDVHDQAGQRLMAEIGPESIQEVVGTFTLSMDWEARTVSGEGPPGAPAVLRLQAAACGDWVPHSRMTILDPAGRFKLGPMDLGPRGFAHPYQVTLLTSSGQRAYREWVRTRVIVHLDRPRLIAETTALTTLSLRTPGLVNASAEADELGRWSLALRDDQRRPHQPQAGEALQLEGADERLSVVVEPLDFDLDPQTGILGQSLPGRRIAIGLRLLDGQYARFSTTADARGRFSFGSADLPPGLAFDQVSRLSLEAETPEGHAMRRDWDRFSAVAPVYLPVIVSPPGP